MTPPPGDAGERAREITQALMTMAGQHERWEERANRYTAIIAAALQSERTAAASQAREVADCLEWLIGRIESPPNGFDPLMESGTQTFLDCKAKLASFRALATPQE